MNFDPQALLAILSQGAQLAGADSKAFTVVAEGAKRFLDARQRTQLNRAMAAGRAAREQTHDAVQEVLTGR